MDSYISCSHASEFFTSMSTSLQVITYHADGCTSLCLQMELQIAKAIHGREHDVPGNCVLNDSS